MKYRSNLTCPDLTPHFKHLVSRPMPHSFGHDVPSDWGDKADDDPVFGLYKNCGMWTHDEAAILFNVAAGKWPLHGLWVDIGAHTGWTSKHINEATNSAVICVDPMLGNVDFCDRFFDNTGYPRSWARGFTSAEMFAGVSPDDKARGFCIDGDHQPGEPLKDAQGAARHLTDTGVIIFHDALGLPVREAALWLMNEGFKARWYSTPHGIILCWRGDFTPPDHVSDPNLPDLKARCPEFPFARCV